MALGSVIGFGLLFVAVTWFVSALMAGAVLTWHASLRGRGAWAERRAAVLAIAVPPVLGAVVVGVLAGDSLFGSSDHCMQHLEHLHLCVVHGAAWIAKHWALVSVSVIGSAVAVRLLARADAIWKSRRLLSEVETFSAPAELAGTAVMIVPTEQPMCFTAGARSPKIYVSRTIWERLDSGERRAMLAHEQAHVNHGDLWRGSLLNAVALLGAPLLAGRMLTLWNQASERLCDRAAAAVVNSEATVASAIASVSRLACAAPGARSFLARADHVEDRIHAVMSERTDGRAAAATMSHVTLAVVAVLTVACVALADPLHHALETLLGTL